MQDVSATPKPARGGRAGTWIKRFGVAGFVFFFVKGMVWLAIFAAGAFGVFRGI